MTIEMVKDILERCAAREEALLEFSTTLSQLRSHYEGRYAAYAWGGCVGTFDTLREASRAAYAAYTAPEQEG